MVIFTQSITLRRKLGTTSFFLYYNAKMFQILLALTRECDIYPKIFCHTFPCGYSSFTEGAIPTLQTTVNEESDQELRGSLSLQ